MPAVMQVAAKSMGMLPAEFEKAMENGELVAEKLLPALTKGFRDLAAPGLADAMKQVSMSQKKMMARFKIFRDKIFQSGLGELFKEIFEMLDDAMVALEPLAVFLTSALTTFIRSVLFPIRFIFAAIADLFTIINYNMKKYLGFDLTKTAEVLGQIAGFIASIFAGGAGLVSKLLKLGVTHGPIGFMFRAIKGIKDNMAAMPKLVQDFINKLRQIPVIGNMFKTGNVSESAKEAARAAAALRRKRLSQTIDYGTMAGSVNQAAQNLGLMGGIDVQVNLKGDAKDMFETKTETTGSLNMNVR